jgi:hypothetical protein
MYAARASETVANLLRLFVLLFDDPIADGCFVTIFDQINIALVTIIPASSVWQCVQPCVATNRLEIDLRGKCHNFISSLKVGILRRFGDEEQMETDARSSVQVKLEIMQRRNCDGVAPGVWHRSNDGKKRDSM